MELGSERADAVVEVGADAGDGAGAEAGWLALGLALLGAFWAHVEASCAILGRIPNASGAHLGASWIDLRRILDASWMYCFLSSPWGA